MSDPTVPNGTDRRCRGRNHHEAADDGPGTGDGAGGVAAKPLRLMFDENLSPKVAKALHLVDKDVQWAGKGGRFPKGTPDEVIVEAMAAEGRYMFTKNFDMVMAWADAGGHFIWLDPRHEPTKHDQARLVFTMWDRWERHLEDDEVECLGVGLSTIHPLTAEAGRDLAAARFEKHQAAIRRAAQRDEQQSELDFSDDD